MKTKVKITGMTCGGCVNAVKGLLSQIDGIDQIDINLETSEVDITAEKNISNDAIKQALSVLPNYQLAE